MSETTDIEIITQVGASVVYEQDKAFIDMQISTAKAFPRNIKRATENAVAIATMDYDTAKSCNFSVPRGGKPITGKSIHLAKIIVQCWGNMRAETRVVATDNTHVTSEAIAFDLENNLAIKVQVKRSIVGKSGRYSEDMITVTGNAANSIALRNAIFAVVPTSVSDRVYNAAKKVITGDISDKDKLITKRKQVLDGLKDTYGVTEQEVLKAIGKAAVDHITGDDIITIIGIGQAIKDGDTTVEEAFRGVNNTGIPPKDDVDHLSERIKKLIKAADSLEKLKSVEKDLKQEHFDMYTAKLDELKANGKA